MTLEEAVKFLHGTGIVVMVLLAVIFVFIVGSIKLLYLCFDLLGVGGRSVDKALHVFKDGG